jgi:hypothetical protein
MLVGYEVVANVLRTHTHCGQAESLSAAIDETNTQRAISNKMDRDANDLAFK